MAALRSNVSVLVREKNNVYHMRGKHNQHFAFHIEIMRFILQIVKGWDRETACQKCHNDITHEEAEELIDS